MTVLGLRPQPLGVLPLPAGGLLLTACDGAPGLVADLGRGILPQVWPDGAKVLQLALAGDLHGALALCEPEGVAADDTSVPGGLPDRADSGRDHPDPVGSSAGRAFNAFVLDPVQHRYDTARALLEGARATDPTAPDALVLLEAAAFTAGLRDSAPDEGALTGELRAVALLTRAADALEHGSPETVATQLEAAVEAARPVLPALAAQLLGTLADIRPDDAVALLTEALSLLPTGHQTQVRAELLYGRAVALQSQAGGRAGVLKEAVRCYQQALVVFRRETHPELFAEAQTNLALCHLATPMVEAGDQLRLGIAVQALRDALTVWTREEHPERWASVTLNLANALQYLPSTHREDNLAEAVEHYEELLELRPVERDPLGHARVLANQGNALAHLGITAHAGEKLERARELFAAAGDEASATAVAATLVELEAVRTLERETA